MTNVVKMVVEHRILGEGSLVIAKNVKTVEKDHFLLKELAIFGMFCGVVR